jgi:hypothetical protein
MDGYTETLRGADVVIIADKDEPGRNHAQLVAGKLHGVAKSVRVIELPDTGGKTVKDAADFFAAGGTAETIFELVDRLRPSRRAGPPLYGPIQVTKLSKSSSTRNFCPISFQ